MRSTRRHSAVGVFVTPLMWIGAQLGVAAYADEANAPYGDSTVQAAGQSSNEPTALAEVIVTARKRDERALDIPESLTVISAADLVNKGIETVEDLGRQTPNLQLNMRQDLTTNVVIRGVGAFGDVLGVGFSIDNVPNFTDQTMRLEDLESVEVLKGPQGTLYGGSSIGGLIRYVSKKPSFDWSGEVSAEAGSFDQLNVFAAQNFVLIPDQLALRLSAYDAKSDGWITNKALGIDGNPSTDYGARAVLLFRPNDAFSALLTLRHSYIKNGADEYAPITGVMSYTYDAPFFQPTFNSRTTYGAVLELNGDLGPLQLTSISSDTYALYAQSADISFTPPDVPGQSLITLPGNRPTRVDTQEFRVTSPSGHPFQWLGGLYGAIIEDVLLNRNAVANYPPPPETTVVNDFQTKRTDAAIFGNASYSFGPLSLEGGLRLTQTQFKANVFVEAGGLPDQSGSITSRAALPKVSLSYGLPTGERVYATVAKGMEPGAVNTVSTAPLPYKSETAVSYELGTKGEAADHRLEYELAAFYVNNDNHQYETNQYIASEGGLVTLINNIGDSRTYGAELSTTWRVNQEITVGASGGYLNAKWKTATVFGESIDGNTIPNAPDVTASANASYSRAVFEHLRFDANVDMSYTDAMWWDLPNTPASKEHPHWLGDLRMALGSDGRGWQVAFRVANILNAKYWTEYFPNFFPAGSEPCTGCNNIGAIGEPRAFLMSVAFRY
jgi:iron complex outermembrane receptor protein